ncbi:hypothetical protein L1049_014378 [Liquidambar formosana]|uniref:F-box protein n=1 Tax=Liquidambar formosana TaxID=63359 RepID=A0AAP0RMW4_LIQFO
MAANPSTTTSTTVDHDGGTTISALHTDILQTHILTRLDGPALASAGCASSTLQALSTEEKLWRDISTSKWPSINDPRVDDLIASFPSGHRSFFSDSFPLLGHRPPSQKINHRPSLPSEIISSVDLYYKNEAIFSKVQETETVTGWFRCSPFRVDLLDPKDSVPTPILHTGGDDTYLSHLRENLTLSWIIIDPTRKRAANLSSLRPVSVQRHWLTGEIHVRYATILTVGDRNVSSEFVQCGVLVTCGGKVGGEMHVREVSMVVEDMEGRNLNGEESLGILQGAIENGKRKKGKRGEEREAYEEYVEMKRERRERKQRRERRLDALCITVAVTIFVGFWSFVLFR